MSSRSNDNGRAYEYIFINVLCQEINKFRHATITENSSLEAAKNAWETLTDEQQYLYTISAQAGIITIFEMEPLLTENGLDELTLFIQKDGCGEDGDVRDIVIIRSSIQWEIGLSLKHNHFAVKHSRLSPSIDFGQKWLGIPCSQTYKNEIKPVFDFMKEAQSKQVKFRDIPNKADIIYLPILKAFMNELKRLYDKNNDVAGRLVEYLLGKFDFYKIISIDNRRFTNVQGFNLHGTLNKPSKEKLPERPVPVAYLPTRILYMGLNEITPRKSMQDTIELCMDNGWQFTFRIHNAETYVKPTLKFDVQIIGMPTAIISIESLWTY